MYVAVGEDEVWYQVRGEAGPPVLLVMGLGLSSSGWKPQYDALQGGHRVLTYDNRGTGQSTCVHPNTGVRSMADDALAVLDAAGWDSAHLVGSSLGGMIAQDFAIRHPERVRSLALIASHPGGSWRHTLPRPWGLYCFVRANLGPMWMRMPWIERVLYSPSYLRRKPPGLPAGTVASLKTLPPMRARLRQLWSCFEHDAEAELRALRDVDTVIVKPGQDRLVPPHNSDRLLGCLPQARFVVLPWAGHGLTASDAVHINAVLAEHFAYAEARLADAVSTAQSSAV